MKRLSPAFLTMVMLGVIGLLVVLYVGKKMFATEEAPPADPMVNVPMALTDLKPGTRITQGHVGLGRARESSLNRDSVRSSRVVVGRVVKNAITAAQPISTKDLYPPGEFPPLDVAKGMRAVTVPVGESTAVVDGLIQPGQYVDVHFTPSNVPNAEETGGLILTLFKGVKILAMNGVSAGASASRGSNTVTLELTPEQANILLLAQDRGVLNLVYTPEGKGTGVVAVDNENRATLNQILGIDPEPEPVDNPPFRTELFSGSGRSVHSFRDGVRVDQWGTAPPVDNSPSPGTVAPGVSPTPKQETPPRSGNGTDGPGADDVQPTNRTAARTNQI